jgi:tetratricopeptide (TPR) repeat protein
MKEKTKTIIVVFFALCSLTLFGQRNKTDSLLVLLKKDKEDTNKVNHLNNLSFALNSTNPDSTILLANQAIALAKKLYFKKGEAAAYNNAGIGYYVKGDYTKALENYFFSLKWNEILNNKKVLPSIFSNIGSIYYKQADYSKALNYYLNALKIVEELGDKKRTATILGNIGIVYSDQSNNTKALDYFFKALKMEEELGRKNGIAAEFSNIGNVYAKLSHYPKALEYFFKALKTDEELGNKSKIAINLGNIGTLYIQTGKFKEAEEYLKRSLAISDSIGALDRIKDAELSLSQLNSEENQKKQVRTEMNYEFEKKQIADSIKNAEQLKQENLKHEQAIQQQRTYTYGGAIGFLLMLVVAVVSFRAYKSKQKANRIIEEQKQLVEEKQKNILDSIHYAKRIQQSLLPTERYIDKKLKELKK